MIFNISINNVDDHLRNHGFLREEKGWRLSPAYDLNPISKFEKAAVLSTAIVDDEFAGNTETALEYCSFFGLETKRAVEVVNEVHAGVSSWKKVACKCGAKDTEIQELQSAFLDTE